MIISRTPFRISFFGGGTDYPCWYLKKSGSVFCTTIDKYCYITCRHLPPFFEHKFRVVYSKIELCKKVSDIIHPSVRSVLEYLNINEGLEIHHDGDLPARTGIGSSSSFTVGLLHALYAIKGEMVDKKKLATEATYIEQQVLQENVGSQDQICASFGGLNKVSFSQDGSIGVSPVILNPKRVQELNSHLMLFCTGIQRTSSNIANEIIEQIESRDKDNVLGRMYEMVDESIDILQNGSNISKFGELLHENWLLKRTLASEVSNSMVDELYSRAIEAGALGGKLTGAGGGGFMLLFVPPERQKNVRESLSDLIHVQFSFEKNGSQIIFYEPTRQKYHQADMDVHHKNIMPFKDLDDMKGRSKFKILSTNSKPQKKVEEIV